MPIPPEMAAFWARFIASVGHIDVARFYEAFHFGDNAELANTLAALVLAGTKRATAGSVWSFEAEGKAPPKPGDLSVVTDWAGIPLCVIQTTQVDIVAFEAVTAEFASVEGEAMVRSSTGVKATPSLSPGSAVVSVAPSAVACRSPVSGSMSSFKSKPMLRPNPSLHPTCYSGLRPLPQAGELKR